MIMRGPSTTHTGAYVGGGAGCAVTGAPWAGQPVSTADGGPKVIRAQAIVPLKQHKLPHGGLGQHLVDIAGQRAGVYSVLGSTEQPTTPDTSASNTAAAGQAQLGRPASTSPQRQGSEHMVTPAGIHRPLPPAPAQPQVVNPSPPTQPTDGVTSWAVWDSAVSQANGTTTSTAGSGDLLSTVAGYVDQYPQILSGVDNSTFLAIVGITAAVVLAMAGSQGGRR